MTSSDVSVDLRGEHTGHHLWSREEIGGDFCTQKSV